MIRRYNGSMPDVDYKLYTAGQVRGLDDAAINGFGIPGYELMQRAGGAVLEEARTRFPTARHWLVLCGPGNNGGDGYVVARLAADIGIQVAVYSLVDPHRLRGDAAIAHADWVASGGVVSQWPPTGELSFDLAFDALLGTGIDRDVGGVYRDAIDYLNRLECPKIAVDIPSGLSADTGCVMGRAVRSAGTVTFVGRKRGMYTADGPDVCGKVRFDDLSIPPEVTRLTNDDPAPVGRLLSSDTLKAFLPARTLNSHKGSYGHVLAVGGIAGMSGAIRLCGEAALRSGAGLVTLVTDPEHARLINLACPELMVRAIGTADDVMPLLDDNHVLAVGPGLGQADWSESLLRVCLESRAPLVVDADGINLLARGVGEDGVPRDNWVLTPHPAEAARLLGCRSADIQRDRVVAAQDIAARYGASVVLKGCGSVVASPGGDYAICPLGNPGMATAGSGDVLTGIIAAMLGQGLPACEAAMAGAVAHAWAGDLAASRMSRTGMTASDITAQLPSVWQVVETDRGQP